MWKGVWSALAWAALITAIALWRFRRKDILS
jgi:ABC-type transport system involved in multi-copper enzyme maturation permease subunit